MPPVNGGCIKCAKGTIRQVGVGADGVLMGEASGFHVGYDRLAVIASAASLATGARGSLMENTSLFQKESESTRVQNKL